MHNADEPSTARIAPNLLDRLTRDHQTVMSTHLHDDLATHGRPPQRTSVRRLPKSETSRESNHRPIMSHVKPQLVGFFPRSKAFEIV